MRRAAALGTSIMAIALAGLLSSGFAEPAKADSSDPIFVFYADSEKEGKAHTSYPPGSGGFEGACGLTVNGGMLYVADHYRNAVDVFTGSRNYVTRLAPQEGAVGPCGMAIAPGGSLYVNYYHQAVVKYQPSPFPVTANTSFGTGQVIDGGNSTGVAVDPVAGRVYVNNRDYIAVYDSAGAPVLEENPVLEEQVPVRIGDGSLVDAYGLAVSNFSTTKGYVYVADAADETIKVFDPTVDLDVPVAVIEGVETPAGTFVSLKDSAVAVDSSIGRVYVVDNLQPAGYERPEAAVYAFAYTGGYVGRFKFNVVHSQPPGLAAVGETVYVTSGNTLGTAVYAYRANAVTGAAFPSPEASILGGGEASAGPSGTSAFLPSPLAPIGATPAEAGIDAPAAEGGTISSPSTQPHRRKAKMPHKGKRHRHSRGRGRR
jgi:DNA-binding beta-propeller fold protein YncE